MGFLQTNETNRRDFNGKAEVYMCKFETKFERNPLFPRGYARYMDDTYTIIKSRKLLAFRNFLNAQNRHCLLDRYNLHMWKKMKMASCRSLTHWSHWSHWSTLFIVLFNLFKQRVHLRCANKLMFKSCIWLHTYTLVEIYLFLLQLQ